MSQDKTADNGRVAKLRKEMLRTPEICTQRGYLWTESYKETESNPVVIRRAKALEKVLKEMTITIGEDELIVGRATSKARGGPILPEFQWQWYLEEMDAISEREWDRFAPLSEEEKAQMKEFLPYWKGKTLYEKWHAMVPESALRLNNKIALLSTYCGANQHYCHVAPDYEMVLTIGLKGIRQRVDDEAGKLILAEVKDFQKFHFFNAVRITLDAVIGFVNRYARLARELSAKETSVRRKNELVRIAETCDRIPENPARDFYEAMQSVWFTYIAAMIEGWGNGIAFGRADQYLYPFYKKDIDEGRITREEAQELISLFYINMSRMLVVQGGESVKYGAGFPLWPNITLGGLTKDGRDAVNELSYIFLEAEKEVRLSAEELIIRIHKNTPDSFVIKACEVAKLARGKLKFVSDEIAIQQLLSDGKPVTYARDYIITGCNTPTVAGRSHDLPGGQLNLPLMLELALNNGISRITGEQLGPRTGDPRNFKSYNEVWEAYKKQVETLLPILLLFKNADKQLYAELAPVPFQSALFPGCIENGRDITDGGTAPYLARAISLSGAPNVGDSLAAIKKSVFEHKKISMEELIDALDNNFEGDERLLQTLKSIPKFGNDVDYVDTIVNEVVVHGSGMATRHRGVSDSISNVGAGIGTANIPMGQMVGALPDGRKAGEPLSEGGISPYQGRAVSGPAATMRSVAKLDHLKLTNGSVLNMRFNPDALKDKAKTRKFASLIRTFCETGGFLVQFNIVSTDMLREAQKHPENFRDMLVRVATYSAYFIELPTELQDDIIARTEFQDA